MAGIVQHLVWSCERAFQVVPFKTLVRHLIAWKRCQRNSIRYPFCEYYLCRNCRAVICVKLNVKMVSFYQRIDCQTFIIICLIALCRHHEGNFAWLKVKVDWSICYYMGHCWIGCCVNCISTIFCGDVPIKIAFDHSVFNHIRIRYVRSDINDDFSMSKDVSFWKIVPQGQGDLERPGLSDRQLDSLVHGMQFHLSNVSGGLIDLKVFSVPLDNFSICSISCDCQVVEIILERSS